MHLRIDPLFPRDLLPGGKRMEDFGLPDVQPLADLESLVRFCGEVGVGNIIHSVAKIALPRDGRLSTVMGRMKPALPRTRRREFLSLPRRLWRLPEEHRSGASCSPSSVDLCRQHRIPAKTCKANLISTP